MKSKIFTAVFLISILFSVSVIAVLWIKNNELKKELNECARYKTFFKSFNGIVCSVAPVKREDTTASIKAIQTDHIGKEYGDIAYHFVLLRGGSFYEGRTLEGIYSGQYTKGAHVASNNTAAGIGLLVLEDFGETSLLNPFTDVLAHQ